MHRCGGGVPPEEHLADAEPEDEGDDVGGLEGPAGSVGQRSTTPNGRKED
jgi:hypothetical protein